MKIDKVAYQKTYSIGPYLTDRVGFEATCNNQDLGETPEQCLSSLMKMADDWHKKSNPHLYQEKIIGIVEHSNGDISLPVISKEPEERRIGIAIADIYSCESLKVLETYRLMAKSKPELQAAYDQQKKKLSQLNSNG